MTTQKVQGNKNVTRPARKGWLPGGCANITKERQEMSTFTFTPATKAQSKLRLAIFGTSGSGKTFTSLRIATGMGGKIALIDTERGSASKYADRFTFDVLELPKKDIDTYCAAISAADSVGYDILIIDSLSHAWRELLEEVDRLATTKFRGNTWSAWSMGTPKQRRFVEAILDFGGHIIATMRTKTEWTTTTDRNGKMKPVRVGLAPVQGKGIEYEFDLLMDISPEHNIHIIKDRTGKYQDEIIEKPGEDLGIALIAWLNEGVPAKKRKPRAKAKVKAKAKEQPAANGSRPYDPAQTRLRLRNNGGWIKGEADDFSDAHRPPDDQQEPPDTRLVQRIAAMMGKALARPEGGDTDLERHLILSWVFDVEHTGLLIAKEARATAKWLEAPAGEDGKPAWIPSGVASEECRLVLYQAMKDAGQQELDLNEAK